MDIRSYDNGGSCDSILRMVDDLWLPPARERQQWRDQCDRQKIATQPCFCVGPQDGQPLCPCRMRSVIIRNGRYIQPEVDLGPVPEKFSKK